MFELNGDGVNNFGSFWLLLYESMILFFNLEEDFLVRVECWCMILCLDDEFIVFDVYVGMVKDLKVLLWKVVVGIWLIMLFGFLMFKFLFVLLLWLGVGDEV